MNWTFWSSSIAALTWLGISVFQAGNRFRRLYSSRPVTWLARTDQSQVCAPLQYMHGHTFSPKYQLRAAQQCRHHFILIFLLQDWGTRTQTCLFLLKKKKKGRKHDKIQARDQGQAKEQPQRAACQQEEVGASALLLVEGEGLTSTPSSCHVPSGLVSMQQWLYLFRA